MSHVLQNPIYKNDKFSLLHKKIEYTSHEHQTWKYLFNKQLKNLKHLAHQNFLDCLYEFSLPKDRIPQLGDVSKKLSSKTGWKVYQVLDLISGDEFFELLANKMFPSTTYIRNDNEVSLSRDPDIFHEIFGHCPALLYSEYAGLFEKFGRIGLQLDELQRGLFQRLFWFTFETGLINTQHGLKLYGGSLLSSIDESRFAIESKEPIRRDFNIVDILRTPYRADLLQPIYYVISDFEELFNMLDDIELIKKNISLAYELGEFYPLFPVDERASKYMNLNACKFTLDSDVAK